MAKIMSTMFVRQQNRQQAAAGSIARGTNIYCIFCCILLPIDLPNVNIIQRCFL
jgi:hypothetical protein